MRDCKVVVPFEREFPQRLKPRDLAAVAARLKPCPSTKLE